MIRPDLDIIRTLAPVIEDIAKHIRVSAINHNPGDYAHLQTVPGIGDMLPDYLQQVNYENVAELPEA